MKRFLSFLLPLLLLPVVVYGQNDPTVRNIEQVRVLNVDGAIGPAMVDYVGREIESVDRNQADMILIQLDTPGGLVDATRDLIQQIIAAPVPVTVYVAPSGARAASAGTFIVYAAHIAGMAPGTNIGAATPVQMGGGGGGGSPLPDMPGQRGEPSEEEKQAAKDNAEKIGNKAMQDTLAFIRSIAELRGRNVEWAEKAVREAATLTANEAVDQNVIDIVAGDVDDFLAQMNGLITTINGEEVTLNTDNVETTSVEPDWRTALLSVLTNPNIAFILMTLGVYGLFFELSNPGAVIPGVIGVIFLTLGLFALNVLPVNMAGLALLGIGLAFMVAEAFIPSFGILGIGGGIAFAIGATILIDTDVPQYSLSWWTIGTMTFLTMGVVIGVIYFALSSHAKPVTTGKEALVNDTAKVVEWDDDNQTGRVRVQGEIWNAESEDDLTLSAGDTVMVSGAHDLMLEITNYNEQTENKG
jgi:membrane-bound serine protease (ClpP class)